MSFKSWKEEFYPKEADDYINRTDKSCLKHSIQKWEGALPENLEKHQVNYKEHAVFDLPTTQALHYHGMTCALCRKYDEASPYEDDCDCYSSGTDEYCPIVRVKGTTCNDIYTITKNDPTDMINLLKDVLETIEND